MQNSEKTSSLKAVKAALSYVLSAVLALYMPVMAYAGEYDIDLGSVDIHAYEDRTEVTHQENTYNDNSPTVFSQSGDTTQNTITITAEENSTANVTISNVHIDTRTDTSSNSSAGAEAISVNGEGNVNIEIDGNNSLRAGSHNAAIADNLSGQLTIRDENGNGNVTATAGVGGAGIGGGYNGAGSNITIESGTVIATGGDGSAGNGGAGIGGGFNQITSKITITGGNP